MSRNAGWLVVRLSLLSREITVAGEAAAAEICTPKFGATPVTQSRTSCVTSTVTYSLAVAVGTFSRNGERKVGRVLNVTPVSVHALVTCAISTPPGLDTVFR
jgi:hypothetical protein